MLVPGSFLTSPAGRGRLPCCRLPGTGRSRMAGRVPCLQTVAPPFLSFPSLPSRVEGGQTGLRRGRTWGCPLSPASWVGVPTELRDLSLGQGAQRASLRVRGTPAWRNPRNPGGRGTPRGPSPRPGFGSSPAGPGLRLRTWRDAEGSRAGAGERGAQGALRTRWPPAPAGCGAARTWPMTRRSRVPAGGGGAGLHPPALTWTAERTREAPAP